MIRKGINPNLQTRIREYLKFIWKEQKSNKEEEEKIITSLSNSLKEELFLESYGFFLKNNSLFTNYFSEKTLKKLVYVMQEVVLTPDDYVYLVKITISIFEIGFISKTIKRTILQYISLERAMLIYIREAMAHLFCLKN